jgi:hypothetical protein
MKYSYTIKEIDKPTALEMVQKYHYSNALPSINKHFIGFYLEDELVGVVTLGWGTRPLHTIKCLFPSLESKDYYEIGRMCMTEEMPRNSESQMIAHLVKWVRRNCPEVKVLFTWADGMMGKPGYVYQASNFLYAGHIVTDFYLKDGVKIHPRQTRKIFSPNDARLSVRPTVAQMQQYGIEHYKGKQFRYVLFLCNRAEQKRLLGECTTSLNRNYPKASDLWWRRQTGPGAWTDCDKPAYKTDFCRDNVIAFDFMKTQEQEVILEEWML